MIRKCKHFDCGIEFNATGKGTKPYKYCGKHRTRMADKRRYMSRHPERYKATRRNTMRRKRAKDPTQYLKDVVCRRINMCLSTQGKHGSTSEILGCSYEFFKSHIEKQFRDGMTWENRGKVWQLDHIKPISLAKNDKEVYELSHYTNFQPLFTEENIKKSNKWNGD